MLAGGGAQRSRRWARSAAQRALAALTADLHQKQASFLCESRSPSAGKSSENFHAFSDFCVDAESKIVGKFCCKFRVHCGTNAEGGAAHDTQDAWLGHFTRALR